MKPGRAVFNHRPTAAGIGAVGQPYVGSGTAFIDADLDGWEELLIVNGHAIRHPKTTTREQRPVLLLNQGGTFRLASGRPGGYSEVPP